MQSWIQVFPEGRQIAHYLKKSGFGKSCKFIPKNWLFIPPVSSVFISKLRLTGTNSIQSEMFSTSCSFSGKFGKIVSFRPFLGGLAPLPTENPGSTPELFHFLFTKMSGCYIGKINLYMQQIVSSFVLDLIVKAVIVAGAACSSLLI